MYHNDEENQKQLEARAKEIDAILAPLCTKQGLKMIEYLEDVFVNREVVRANDTQFGAGIRQGEANVVLQLRKTYERITNGKR